MAAERSTRTNWEEAGERCATESESPGSRPTLWRVAARATVRRSVHQCAQRADTERLVAVAVVQRRSAAHWPVQGVPVRAHSRPLPGGWQLRTRSRAGRSGQHARLSGLRRSETVAVCDLAQHNLGQCRLHRLRAQSCRSFLERLRWGVRLTILWWQRNAPQASDEANETTLC